MNTTKVEDIDFSKGYFHFTHKDNLKSIQKLGLVPKIGDNAENLEKSEKSFFSFGGAGILQLCNIWIKWLAFKQQKQRYKSKAANSKERALLLQKFYDDFKNSKIYTKSVMEEIYSNFFSFMSNNVFLKLNLVEGEDFKSNDIDEVKIMLKSRPEMLQAMYGKTKHDEKNLFCMEDWNMHTIPGKIIEPSKIEVIKTGKSLSAKDTLKYVYEKTDKTALDLKFLDDFFKTCKSVKREYV